MADAAPSNQRLHVERADTASRQIMRGSAAGRRPLDPGEEAGRVGMMIEESLDVRLQRLIPSASRAQEVVALPERATDRLVVNRLDALPASRVHTARILVREVQRHLSYARSLDR